MEEMWVLKTSIVAFKLHQNRHFHTKFYISEKFSDKLQFAWWRSSCPFVVTPLVTALLSLFDNGAGPAYLLFIYLA